MQRRRFGRIVNFGTVADAAAPRGRGDLRGLQGGGRLADARARARARRVRNHGQRGRAHARRDRSDPQRAAEKIDRLVARQAIRRLGEFRDVVNVVDFFLQPGERLRDGPGPLPSAASDDRFPARRVRREPRCTTPSSGAAQTVPLRLAARARREWTGTARARGRRARHGRRDRGRLLAERGRAVSRARRSPLRPGAADERGRRQEDGVPRDRRGRAVIFDRRARRGALDATRPDRDAPASTRRCASAATPGLVLFSSGSTGKSKAAVHDLAGILEKFRDAAPRAADDLVPALRPHRRRQHAALHALQRRLPRDRAGPHARTPCSRRSSGTASSCCRPRRRS